jgi:hypothetical protein
MSTGESDSDLSGSSSKWKMLMQLLPQINETTTFESLPSCMDTLVKHANAHTKNSHENKKQKQKHNVYSTTSFVFICSSHAIAMLFKAMQIQRCEAWLLPWLVLSATSVIPSHKYVLQAREHMQ